MVGGEVEHISAWCWVPRAWAVSRRRRYLMGPTAFAAVDANPKDQCVAGATWRWIRRMDQEMVAMLGKRRKEKSASNLEVKGGDVGHG